MLNHALARWRAREKSVGAWLTMSDLYSAEILAQLGFDWVCFDLQHGLMDYSHLTHLLPAIAQARVTPLVRVAANQPDQIGKALDAGAQGVIVPLVNTVEDARKAVAACRYPPAGVRSCGPIRAAMHEGLAYLQTANEQVACVVMIETEEGLRNVETIAATDGVDGLFVGPMDLCYGLGLAPGSFTDARFQQALGAILAACSKHDRAAGIFGYTPEMAAQSLQAGFDFVSAGTDGNFLRAGAAQALGVARGQGTAAAPSTPPDSGY